MKVKACPTCGRRYLMHCFHHGREIKTVEMSPQDAALRIEGEIKKLKAELQSAEWDLQFYKANYETK